MILPFFLSLLVDESTATERRRRLHELRNRLGAAAPRPIALPDFRTVFLSALARNGWDVLDDPLLRTVQGNRRAAWLRLLDRHARFGGASAAAGRVASLDPKINTR